MTTFFPNTKSMLKGCSAGAAINAAGVVAGRFHDANLVARTHLRIP
jgi:hypothetical protein